MGAIGAAWCGIILCPPTQSSSASCYALHTILTFMLCPSRHIFYPLINDFFLLFCRVLWGWIFWNFSPCKHQTLIVKAWFGGTQKYWAFVRGAQGYVGHFRINIYISIDIPQECWWGWYWRSIRWSSAPLQELISRPCLQGSFSPSLPLPSTCKRSGKSRKKSIIKVFYHHSPTNNSQG